MFSEIKPANKVEDIPEEELCYAFEYIDSISPPKREYSDPRPDISAIFSYLHELYNYGGLIKPQKITDIDEIQRSLHKDQIGKLVDIFTENALSTDSLIFNQQFKPEKHLFTVSFTDLTSCNWFGYRNYKGESIYMDSLFGIMVEHNGKICLKISFEPDILNNSLLICQIQGGEDARSVAGFMDLTKSAISIVQSIARQSNFNFVDVVSPRMHEKYVNPDHPNFDSRHKTTVEVLNKQYISNPRIAGLEIFIPKISQVEKKIRRRIGSYVKI